MTLITGVFHPDYISVMADGRTTTPTEIVSENEMKIRRIGDKAVLAIGGNTFTANKTFEFAQAYFAQYSSMGFRGLVNMVGQITRDQLYTPYPIHLLIAGFNDSNVLQAAYMGNQTDFNFVPIQNVERPYFIPLGSGLEITNHKIQQAEIEFDHMDKNNVEEVSNLQKRLNDSVATTDRTVNENTQHIFIPKT